ncbi:MAG: hypothetical protein LQ342_000639 [Letrouitia transgressa]|nr:MAG: hypothetical protein LQ342_000639 [Letrouitia transgressa]
MRSIIFPLVLLAPLSLATPLFSHPSHDEAGPSKAGLKARDPHRFFRPSLVEDIFPSGTFPSVVFPSGAFTSFTAVAQPGIGLPGSGGGTAGSGTAGRVSVGNVRGSGNRAVAGVRGKDGARGKDGVRGKDGADGEDGEDADVVVNGVSNPLADPLSAANHDKR